LSLDDRIMRLLYVVGDDPVLFVDTVTIGVTSAYRAESMQAWNDALDRIAAGRTNMAVLHWSERAQPEWFQPDGIHYTPGGRVWRAAITAVGLAESFPA
jgi:hypothetical protein